MRAFATLAICLAIGGSIAAASDDKFEVAGDIVTYDTERDTGTGRSEIGYGDHEQLLALLKDHPDVTTLRLNSRGGKVYAGFRMADIVIDFGLDTEVDGVCNSACVYIFLGGQARRMTGGSRIGFHHRTWASADIASYYDKWREDEGWTTLFDFAAWLYIDTQIESYEEMKYFLERGVDPGFAIETMKDRDGDLWYPRRTDLLAAGVLTE